MGTRAKIAISLAPEVLALVDSSRGRSVTLAVHRRGAATRLQSREWERLSAQLDPEETAGEIAWLIVVCAVTTRSAARSGPAPGAAQRRSR